MLIKSVVAVNAIVVLYLKKFQFERKKVITKKYCRLKHNGT